ncbi:MAG: hypothetical protein K2X49_23640 [Acetobacteraceae bacterium]|nr:hypothetical protein [Acetobacteraceae bacterium]
MRSHSDPAPALLSVLLGAAVLLGGCEQRFAGVPVDDAQARAARTAQPPVGGVAPQTYPQWGGSMPPPFAAYGAGAPIFGAPVQGGAAVSGVSGLGGGVPAR